ncbi:hypothetical protein AUI07_09550 [archaeon 13_2_20CM_2_53_6]|nr:MAG: hypothetical protein AUI07_09550 [archaeon 13_2_20CM_2_53_6]
MIRLRCQGFLQDLGTCFNDAIQKLNYPGLTIDTTEGGRGDTLSKVFLPDFLSFACEGLVGTSAADGEHVGPSAR